MTDAQLRSDAQDELGWQPIVDDDAIAVSAHDGVVTVRRQRLYNLVRVNATEEHLLTLRPDPGVTGFAFTFG